MQVHFLVLVIVVHSLLVETIDLLLLILLFWRVLAELVVLHSRPPSWTPLLNLQHLFSIFVAF